MKSPVAMDGAFLFVMGIWMSQEGTEMSLKLVRPEERYAAQVMAYKEEMLLNGDGLHGCAGLEKVSTYAEWADFDNRLRKEYGESYTPSEVFLAVRSEDDRVVGIMDYRHSPLPPFLLEYGGNIGFSVRPTERRKGYANEMLKQLLPICRAYGEQRGLLTCDKTNDASRKTIVKNGGVLENEVMDGGKLSAGGMVQRYWIGL